MKLAEALAKRSEIKKEVNSLRAMSSYSSAANFSYVVFEKDHAPVIEGADEIAKEELQRFTDLHENLRDVVRVITTANQTNATKDGMKLADALIARDHAKRMSEAYRNIASRLPTSQKVTKRGEGLTLDMLRAEKTDGVDLARLKQEQDETRTITLTVLSQQDAKKQADAFAAEYRALDTAIQEANWTVDVDLVLKDTGITQDPLAI